MNGYVILEVNYSSCSSFVWPVVYSSLESCHESIFFDHRFVTDYSLEKVDDKYFKILKGDFIIGVLIIQAVFCEN